MKSHNRNYNLSYIPLQLHLFHLFILLLLNYSLLPLVNGENIMKVNNNNNNNNNEQLDKHFKAASYVKMNNHYKDNRNVAESDDVLSELKRPHRSLFLGKLLQNSLLGKTFKQNFNSFVKNKMTTNKCHQCNANADDYTTKNYNYEQNLYNLIRNLTSYNPWSYDNKDERPIKYLPILYRPTIHISQPAQQQQYYHHHHQQQQQLYGNNQRGDCFMKNTIWSYPLECLLYRKESLPYSMPQLNVITSSSGERAYLVYETAKSQPLTTYNLSQYPYYYYTPIQLTMNDQPYRDCPELFTEYNRRLKQDYFNY